MLRPREEATMTAWLPRAGAVLAVCGLALAAAACGGGAGGSGSSTGASGPGSSRRIVTHPVIGAILMQQDQFFRLNEQGMREAAASHQADLKVQNAGGALDK